jgi:predicted transcriptional regulator
MSTKKSAIDQRIRDSIDSHCAKLYVQGGKSTTDIAGLMGLAPSAVRSALQRAGVQLRPRVNPHQIEKRRCAFALKRMEKFITDEEPLC